MLGRTLRLRGGSCVGPDFRVTASVRGGSLGCVGPDFKVRVKVRVGRLGA